MDSLIDLELLLLLTHLSHFSKFYGMFNHLNIILKIIVKMHVHAIK